MIEVEYDYRHYGDCTQGIDILPKFHFGIFHLTGG